MLKITVPETEYYDEAKETFESLGSVEVVLQHSLFSLSKWESEFEKPFLSSTDKAPEEIMGYIRHMIISPEENSHIISRFSQENLEEINRYVESKHTATSFGVTPKQSGRGKSLHPS